MIGWSTVAQAQDLGVEFLAPPPPNFVAVGQEFGIQVRFTNDPAGDAPHAVDDATYTITLDAGLEVAALPSPFGVEVTSPDPHTIVVTTQMLLSSVYTEGFLVRATSAGDRTMAVAVTPPDDDGNTANDTDETSVGAVVVGGNNPPVVNFPITDQTLIVGGSAFSISLNSVFADPDGDALTFEASSSDEAVATASISGTTLTVTPVADGATTITVTANDGNGGTTDDVFDVTVEAQQQQQADLAVQLNIEAAGKAGGLDWQVGDNVRWNINIDNNGPDDAEDFLLEFNLPPLVKLDPEELARLEGEGFEVSNGNGYQLTLQEEEFPVSSHMVWVEGTLVEEGEASTWVSVTSATPDPVPDNNMAQEQFTITLPSLLITKSIPQEVMDRAPIPLGTPIPFTITVTNSDLTATATDVVVTDVVPTDFGNFNPGVNPRPSQGTCTIGPGPGISVEEVLTCTLGTLDPGRSATIDVEVIVHTRPPEDEFCNIAGAQGSFGGATVNGDSGPRTCIKVREPLPLIKKTGPLFFTVGDSVAFTITVSNPTSATFSDLAVFDTFSATEFAFISATASSPTIHCDEGFGVNVICTIETLQPGEEVTMTITLRALFVGELCNAAQVVKNPSTTQDSLAETTYCPKSLLGDLTVTKRLLTPGGVFAVGEVLDFEITVVNDSEAAVQGISVFDIVDLGLEFEEGASPSGACEQAIFGVGVDCPVGTLAPGAEARVTVRFEITGIGVGLDESAEVCNNANAQYGSAGGGVAEPVCFGVQGGLLPRADAIEALQGYVDDNYPGSTSVAAFLTPSPVPPGSTVASSEGAIQWDMNTATWVGYVTEDPTALHTKPAEALLIDNDGQVQAAPVTGWVTVTTDGATAAFPGHDDLVIGTLGTPPPAEDTVADPDELATPTEQTCAVLTTGLARSNGIDGGTLLEMEGFEATLSLMFSEVIVEKQSPRASEGKLFTLDQASRAGITSQLEALNDQCDHLIFYYYGHGRPGVMVTKEERPRDRMTYANLAAALFATEAPTITVVLDACHAGSAGVDFSLYDAFKQRDVTILASAADGKQAYAPFIGRNQFGTSVPIGLFTHTLTECMGQSSTDTDGDGQTSFVEGFDCVLARNPFIDPTRPADGRLREKQNPQKFVNRVQPVESGTAAFPEQGVTVQTDGAGKTTARQALDAVRVQEVHPRDGAPGTDPALLALTPGRYRTVEMLEGGEAASGFTVAITFSVDALFDTLAVEGTPGLAFRVSDDEPWQPYTSTVWNPDDSTVTAQGVTFSADWAIAVVDEAGAVVIETLPGEVPAAFALHANYPNPFNPQTTIRFDVPERAHVHLAVFDVLGRLVETLVDGALAPGTHEAVFEARGLPSGLYVYRIEMGAFTHARTMLLLR